LAAVLTVLPSLGASPGSGGALAQEAPNTQRDCKTVLQCRFTRGGVYRGCISAYTCRTCRTVQSRCQTGPDGRRTCSRVVCSWGA